MPRSRTKGGASKNVAATTAPVPLLDSIRAQMQSTSAKDNNNESHVDNLKVSTSGWQCDIDDWSDTHGPDKFPPTLRSMERKTEQAKNNFFPERENKSGIKQQIHNQTKEISSNNIDISKLSLIVTDLITNKCDQSAYTDFLTILQDYSVHSTRDDHLEETVYHLIQSAVSFIRSNEQRFDQSKLQECYHKRHVLKTNSVQ